MHPRIYSVLKSPDVKGLLAKKLPYLFQIAEIESSRAGKIGMEVGSLRERILIAFFIQTFGHGNVNTEIPITESEVDVEVHGIPISIKTITGALSGIKMIWTVDWGSLDEFYNNYAPKCDIFLCQIKWDDVGGLFYIPLDVQKKTFSQIGRENYIKLPKRGTNPRGAEFSKNAIEKLVGHPDTISIDINWKKQDLKYNPIDRWLEFWAE